MKKLSDWLNVLTRSVLAGMMIGIGGTVYLSNESKLAGAFLFSIGLFLICAYEFQLFTGRIGYLVNQGPTYLGNLGIILIGNFIGTYLVAILIRNTRLIHVAEKAVLLSEAKLSDDLLSILILSFFCGTLMYLGVEGYKTIGDPVGKYLALFLAVMVFILSGFEHCIANMFYFTLADVWSVTSAFYLAIMVLGNAAGAIFFAHMRRILSKQRTQKEAIKAMSGIK